MIKFQAGIDPKQLDKKLKDMLDILVKAVDFDMEVTSGFRSVEKNEEVGGIKGSSHCKGLAVDIAISDSFQRFKVIFGALASGFKRIGVGPTHIHLDCDPEKPQPIIFPDGYKI